MPEFALRRTWLVPLVAIALPAMLTLWLVEPRVAALWLNTALLAVGACLIALPLGAIAAVLIVKTDTPGRSLAAMTFVGMLFLPLYLVTGAWNAGFGIQGWHTMATNPHLAHRPWLDGWRGAIWVHGIAAVPWVALILAAGLRAVEAEIEEDAATCATPVRVLWHVSLRRAAPAFIVAALWVAIVAAAEISVTDIFQVRTFAEEVFTQAALGSFDDGAALSAVGLWLGLAIITALAVSAIGMAGKLVSDFVDAIHRPPWIWRMGRSRWPAAGALWGTMLLVAGVPLVNLIYKAGVLVSSTDAGLSRSWSAVKVIERVLRAPVEFHADLWLSARIGLLATTAAIVAAVPLAWSMRSARRLPWLRLSLIAICLTVPGPLLGVGLTRLLNQPADSSLAILGWLYDTNFAPWLVQSLRALPLATLILWPALASVPQVMLDTAATEGSGPMSRLLRIALPQRWPAVAAAWLIGFAIAIGELAATVLVIPPQRGATAISIHIFQLLHYGVDDRVAAISLVTVAGISALTAAAAALLKRTGGTP
jgi:iron(III) transport system permease protein